MTAIVFDASLVANWLLDDERDPRAAAAVSRLDEARGLVPQLWQYEIRNVLLVATRRQRLSPDEATRHLATIDGLPFETDTAAELASTFALAMKHNLSFYDALYLELACRRRAILATFDARLLAAARAEGVAWD